MAELASSVTQRRLQARLTYMSYILSILSD